MNEKPKIAMQIVHLEASGRDLTEGWTAGPIEDITFVPANLAKDLQKQLEQAGLMNKRMAG